MKPFRFRVDRRIDFRTIVCIVAIGAGTRKALAVQFAHQQAAGESNR